jgi:urease beta subunit
MRGLARPRIPLPTVPRADQLIPFDCALPQRPAAVQANIIHRGNRPVHIGNANHFVATRKFLGFAFRRKFGLRGQLNEVGQGTLWNPEA